MKAIVKFNPSSKRDVRKAFAFVKSHMSAAEVVAAEQIPSHGDMTDAEYFTALAEDLSEEAFDRFRRPFTMRELVDAVTDIGWDLQTPANQAYLENAFVRACIKDADFYENTAFRILPELKDDAAQYLVTCATDKDKAVEPTVSADPRITTLLNALKPFVEHHSAWNGAQAAQHFGLLSPAVFKDAAEAYAAISASVSALAAGASETEYLGSLEDAIKALAEDDLQLVLWHVPIYVLRIGDEIRRISFDKESLIHLGKTANSLHGSSWSVSEGRVKRDISKYTIAAGGFAVGEEPDANDEIGEQK